MIKIFNYIFIVTYFMFNLFVIFRKAIAAL